MRIHLALAVAATCLFAAGAHAQTQQSCTATLSGASEVPPTDSKGTGNVKATYDPASKKLSWENTYSGLSGPASAAHFHGPGAAGANAGVQVPMQGSLDSPMKGSATLTEAQATMLHQGQMYFNIHTAKNPAGEIRGQVTCK